MDDQTELKTGVDVVQCPSKKLDKALLALKVRRTVTEQQIDRVNDFAKRIQEDSSGVSLATTLKVCISRLNNSYSNQTIHVSHAILSDEKYDTTKLPKIELCEFSGDNTTWIAWFDEFTSLVHNNERLNTFTKLHHLVSILSPAAKAPLAGIKIIAKNYEIILQSLSAADRSNKVHALKLCVNCLKFKKHNLSDCTSKGHCHTCGKGHHSLLHFERPQVANYTASKHNQINKTNHIEPAEIANHNMSDQAQPKNFAVLKTQHTERNILATAIVYIISKYKQRFPCRVLLDGGSQINMISERMVHMTGLKRQFQCANKTLSHMEIVQSFDFSQPNYVLPHHCI
uniref:Peptidase aspartic putative domain-containing protein n=1 Tax=Glossina palpalis gambiensis TaxID=67801 RepID=A0A1B0C3X7_9MUSC